MAAYHLIDQQNDFIVISKNCGVSVHRDQAATGFVEQLEAELGIEKLYLVHRLDKMTSGLLLLATNPQAAAALGEAFAARQVDKTYIALSDKKPTKKQGWIKGDMEKSRAGSWRLVKSQLKPAVTRFYSAALTPGIRLFLLKPLTGRTHQLRVALKSIGAPIIGDERYHNRTVALKADRGYLHAWRVAFELNGQRFSYQDNPGEGLLFQHASLLPVLAKLQSKMALSASNC